MSFDGITELFCIDAHLSCLLSSQRDIKSERDADCCFCPSSVKEAMLINPSPCLNVVVTLGLI